MRAVALLSLLLLSGCAATRSPLPADAADVLPALEARLLGAESVSLSFFHITATGMSETDLKGGLWLDVEDFYPAPQTHLFALGTFEGDEARVRLRAGNDAMRLSRGDSLVAETERPPALREALALGFTRMGLLHNLARLTAAQPPDRAEGGVAQWVIVHGAAWGTRRTIDGRAVQGLRFDLRVSGTEAGTATLWLDAATGLPVRRDQVVRFPDGTMTVTESYRSWSLGRD